jgi:hypothetical protein
MQHVTIINRANDAMMKNSIDDERRLPCEKGKENCFIHVVSSDAVAF